jgi:hypothetical protein
LLGAYSVRDILWLRVLAVASSLAAIPYFLLQPTPLWAAFGWSVSRSPAAAVTQDPMLSTCRTFRGARSLKTIVQRVAA